MTNRMATRSTPRPSKTRARTSAPIAIANRALTEQEFERARRTLMRRDPRLGALIKRVGRCCLPDSRGREPFAGLVRVIMSQQLSGKAADTIYGRVEQLAGGRGAMTPATLRAVDATALRGAGVSRPKISYLYDLSDRVADGRLDLHALDGHPDEEVIAQITAVKGLGRWSAEMFLMFRLNRPDIFPVGDLGIVKGVQKLFGIKRRPSPRTMERLAEPWRPYRSVAAWYLWRLHD